jgi:hypothetical protein
LGAGGRQFESGHPDKTKDKRANHSGWLFDFKIRCDSSLLERAKDFKIKITAGNFCLLF